MKRTVIPGRFQPFHLGHLHAVKWLLNRCDELIIAVCSAQKSHTLENPFTAGERILMIRETLRKEGVDPWRIMIAPVQDIEYNSIWVCYLESILPPFDSAASRNPLVIRLFKERGYSILQPPLTRREEYSGVRIRRMMLEGDDKWKKLVPEPVVEVIEHIGGVERLRELAKTDEVIRG